MEQDMVFNPRWSDLPSTLSVEERGDAAILRLSRPAKRNAINPEMLKGIVQFFGALPEGARTVIIHGEGDHFCAGADFSSILAIDVASKSTLAKLRLSRLWHHAFAQIENADMPVVAPSWVAVWNWRQPHISGSPSATPFMLFLKRVAGFT
jgi:(methylthio)acryloyl-CoA hydratase